MAERLSFIITPELDNKTVKDALDDMETLFKKSSRRIERTMREALKQEGQERVIEYKFQVKDVKGQLAIFKREGKKALSFVDQFKEAGKALRGSLGKTTNELKDQLRYLKELRDNTEKYSQFTGEVTKAWKGINDRIGQVQGALNNINGTAQQFPLIEKLTIANLLANALQGAFNKLTGSIKYVIDTGIKFEQIQLGLQGFIGSAEEADKAMQSFIKTAVESPLNVEQVAEGAKTLLAFGLSADETKDSIDRLAKVAGATGSDLKLLARNLGQVKSQGKAFTRDLNQFGTAGIPIFKELANVIGVTEAEVREMATKGKIGFDQVNQAIVNMTQSGSAFDRIAKKMQNTWGGQIEAMVSAVQLFSAELLRTITAIDDAFFGALQNSLKLAVKGIRGLASVMKELTPIIAILTGAVTGYAAAWVAVNFSTVIGSLQLLGATVINTARAVWTAVAAKTALATAMNPAAGLALAASLAGVTVAVAGVAAKSMEATEEVQALQESLDKDTSAEATMGAIVDKLAKLEVKAKALRKEFEAIGAVKPEKPNRRGRSTLSGRPKQILLEMNKIERERQKILQDIGRELGENNKKLVEQAAATKAAGQPLSDSLDQYKKLQEENNTRWETLTEKAKEHKAAIKDLYGPAIKSREELIQQIRKDNQEEQRLARETRQELVKKYDGQKKALNEVYSQILRNIDAEIGALSKRGPKEQELYDLNKKELKDKIKKGDLEGKELLQLEAQLERMERQEQIQKLQETRKRVQLEQEMRIAQLDKEKEDRLKRFDQAEEAREQKEKDRIKRKEKEIEDLKEQQKIRIAALDKILNREKLQYKNVKDMNTQLQLIQDQYDIIQGDTSKIAENLQAAQKAVDGIAKKTGDLIKAAVAAEKIENSSSRIASRRTQGGAGQRRQAELEGAMAAGGPVLGGSAYQVNELGKEAFLSAAGRLSMINAPAYGKWTAPSSGTVIPAHLTKQLDIPQGGVNLNGQPNFDQRKSGRNPLNSILSALSGAGSDNIQNNVTVQSMNPTKTASDMLVQLTKLRRRRMY